MSIFTKEQAKHYLSRKQVIPDAPPEEREHLTSLEWVQRMISIFSKTGNKTSDQIMEKLFKTTDLLKFVECAEGYTIKPVGRTKLEITTHDGDLGCQTHLFSVKEGDGRKCLRDPLVIDRDLLDSKLIQKNLLKLIDCQKKSRSQPESAESVPSYIKYVARAFAQLTDIDLSKQLER